MKAATATPSRAKARAWRGKSMPRRSDILALEFEDGRDERAISEKHFLQVILIYFSKKLANDWHNKC